MPHRRRPDGRTIVESRPTVGGTTGSSAGACGMSSATEMIATEIDEAHQGAIHLNLLQAILGRRPKAPVRLMVLIIKHTHPSLVSITSLLIENMVDINAMRSASSPNAL